jgi:superfamily I DNA/RNA helicase
MTIHKSKGLTFDKISIVGIDKTMDNEEEQNIAYVACTRAR